MAKFIKSAPGPPTYRGRPACEFRRRLANVARAIATFHRPRYDVAPLGAVSDGAQSVHELLAGLFTGFPDFRVEVVRQHHADEAVVVEFVMTGTHRGPWAGLVATGRRVELRLVGIFEFEADRLMCERV